MAKQIILVALIILFAAVGMTNAQENDVPAAAANLAPAAAAAGIDLNNASQLIGALKGAAANGAPIGGPIPEGAFKNLAPGGSEQPNSGAPAVGASAAARTVAAAGVLGSFFFF